MSQLLNELQRKSQKLDSDWIELILEAKLQELTIEEIREFINQDTN